ncbi:DUF2515 domain-containing protein [Robertmurraya andreesenii]|uniref:DUF2515 domain-containing protein n=1 Tax=Anoxybacillus andreesenii TaxID=1325932 RepID=A0ABT9V0U2_9BACL|nr:DUF2515 domain-containing protein [Robertmurraya andreesenii]MDQ0154564.1 hypothetical protein [Robertmurraya andreesenii]
MFKVKNEKLPPLPEHLVRLKKVLKRKRPEEKPSKPSLQERRIIERIQAKTEQWNLNNVTRTKAYLDFYLQYPEIQWAFLGHMVSRNGGWNMTDLKGGLHTRLLTNKEAKSFFSFLERGNWLIFLDAYPQFLLYEECLRRGENLFHLLPHFHVSTYMETIWNDFWYHRNQYVLTISLVINEQSYLEGRVIHHPTFKKEVFDSLEFMLQDLLSMNHILFPYQENGQIKLVGETLHRFESLHERILLGKRLYQILFGEEERKRAIEDWARATPHTGSRKDYCPSIFNDIEEAVPGTFLKRRLNNCQLRPDANRIYSPTLTNAWKDMNHAEAEIGDWYRSWKVLYYLIDSDLKINGEIKNEYCKTLEKLELAAIAKKAIPFLD